MNRAASNITLVCYDITSCKLRREIVKCMKNFGMRLQFSVFLCRLDACGVSRCREKLQKLLKLLQEEIVSDDSLIIFERFAPDAADCLLGAPIERKLPTFEIF